MIPHRALETTGIIGVVMLATQSGFRVLDAIDDGALAWAFAAGALLGYVAADVVTGLVHWAADSYGTERTPVLGPNFIGPFRFHHTDPEDITRHDVIETNGNSCIVALPALAVAFWWLPDPASGAGWLFAWTAFLTMVVAGVVTNQFHKWAHMTTPPPAAVRALQRLGVILSREHHAVHHAAPFRTYYCITTGWMNWPLRTARFHETLESLLARVGVRRTG